MTSINNNNNLITAKLNQINSTPKVEQKPVEQKQPTEKGSNLINRFLENQAQINQPAVTKVTDSTIFNEESLFN